MLSNSTNINKTDNPHLKQFNTKRQQDMALEIQILDWEKHKHAAGFNQLMRSQFFVLLLNFNI
jgi:hypothetical protein